MSSVSNPGSVNSGSVTTTSLTLGSPLMRSSIEPRSSGVFAKLVNLVTSTAGSLVRGAGLQGVGLQGAGINPEYSNLIQQQMDMQKQMQLVSLYSNIIKSEHETQMAAVRNIRVG